jgi:hypothetical protein
MAKRSELKVGQEWAYGRSRSHFIGSWHQKVTIVAVEPAKQWRYGEIAKTGSGLGVHVQVHESFRGEPKIIEKVVQLSQLFIPWAEYETQKAEYVEARKVAEEKAAIAKAERREFQEKVYQPAFKEFVQAVEAISGQKLYGYETVEKLPIEVIKAITEAVKEKAVA